jgi:hypothetical protein
LPLVLRGSITDDDLRPVLEEQPGGCFPDAAGSVADEGDLTFEGTLVRQIIPSAWT